MAGKLRVVENPLNPFGDQETTDRHEAWEKNFFMVEIWSRDGQHVTRMPHAGNRLDKARKVYDELVAKRPRAHVTLRQRMQVLAEREPSRPQGGSG